MNCEESNYLNADGACTECTDNEYTMNYMGCYEILEPLTLETMSPFECFTKAKAEGLTYIILQEGDKCAAVNDYNYGYLDKQSTFPKEADGT